MDWTLEVVVLPVSDIDRAVAFYRDQVGFDLDHDTRTEHMHVVQLTPRGSGCSVVIGDLPAQNEMAPGSMRGLQLVVADAQAARDELRLARRRGERAAVVRRPGRQHVLRVRGPGREHLGRPGAEGARHEAAHPPAGARPVRGVLTARPAATGARVRAGRRARVLA